MTFNLICASPMVLPVCAMATSLSLAFAVLYGQVFHLSLCLATCGFSLNVELPAAGLFPKTSPLLPMSPAGPDANPGGMNRSEERWGQ